MPAVTDQLVLSDIIIRPMTNLPITQQPHFTDSPVIDLITKSFRTD